MSKEGTFVVDTSYDCLPKKYTRSRLFFDKVELTSSDSSNCLQADWIELYPDGEEAIPLNVSEARSNSISSSIFVDADHAGYQVTRFLVIGLIICVNRAPIL